MASVAERRRTGDPRPHVLVLSDIGAVRSPLFRVLLAKLQPFNVTVTCRDPEAANQQGLDVRFAAHRVEASRLSVGAGWALRRFLGRGQPATTSNGGGAATSAAPLDAVPPKPGNAGIRWRYVLHAARLALSRANVHRRLCRPDVIVAVDGDTLMEARLLAALYRVPMVYIVYELWPNQTPGTPKDLEGAMAYIEGLGVRRSAKVVIPCQSWAVLIRRRYSVPADRMVRINTCGDAAPPVVESPDVHDPVRFYFVGGYTPGRGLEDLILAIKRVRGATLWMRGFGVDEAHLRGLVTREGLEGVVKFLDPVPPEAVADAGRDFDIGVITAIPETLSGRMAVGFRLFHNLASGLAVFAPPSRPLKRFCADHPVGVVYRRHTVEDIAEGLQYCVDRPELVRSWKREANRLARTRYNVEVQGALYRDLLLSCLPSSVRRDAI